MNGKCRRTATPPITGAALAAALAAAVPAIAEISPPPTPHLVTLDNGDRFQCQVNDFEHGGNLVVSHPRADAPLVFDGGALRSIEATATTLPAEPESTVRVVLANGDALPVVGLEFSGGNLAATSSWAGAFEVPWSEVRALDFRSTVGRRLFVGPTPDQGWKSRAHPAYPPAAGSDVWEIAPSVMTSTAPGATAVDWMLPDRFALDFEVESFGPFNFGLGLFLDAFEPLDADDHTAGLVIGRPLEDGIAPHHHGLILEFNSNAVLFLRQIDRSDHEMIGNAQIHDLGNHRTSFARFRLLVNRDSGMLALFCNGQLVERWIEPHGFPIEGRSLGFWQHHWTGPVSIRHLTLREWTGEWDRDTTPADPGHEVITTRSGDRFSGTLGPLTPDGWEFETEHAVLHIAVENIREILRPSCDTAAPPPDSGPSIVLHGDYPLSARSISIENGVLTLIHPVLGELRTPLQHLQSLTYPPPAEP